MPVQTISTVHMTYSAGPNRAGFLYFKEVFKMVKIKVRFPESKKKQRKIADEVRHTGRRLPG